MARKREQKDQQDEATRNFNAALSQVRSHPMFAPLIRHVYVRRYDVGARFADPCPEDGWAVVSTSGRIYVHPKRRADPEEWVYVLVHCLLHLGFGHLRTDRKPDEWNAACDCFVAAFIRDLRIGRPPQCMDLPFQLPSQSEERLYEQFVERGIPPELRRLGTAGGAKDMLTGAHFGRRDDIEGWKRLLGQGLIAAVTSAVSVAAGYETSLGQSNDALTPARRARSWIINSYPLLGSLAAGLQIIEDREICDRLGIRVAAVDPESGEIFMNPTAGLDERESRFVLAHELLHVGLRHGPRRQGRDMFFWNLACDFVINGWLMEMDFGDLPRVGGLYDADLKSESAERIYDRIVTDIRRYRKLCTLAGVGICDILDRGNPDWWNSGDGIGLDDLYRRCLSQGLEYHREQGRGFLPAGLIEEIRALDQPPIPWDVELARWFDDHFAPLEKVRSYARPSRRQSSTPDIPRPRYVPMLGSDEGRTFGVVLDTSGSMDRALLGKALGTIASYAVARDVPRVRVVFCDAEAHDQGYMPPDDLLDRVKVRGRGGTVLQPGINLLEKAEDFPEDGPLLIITDGMCDRLRIRREHAFLIPHGHSLPFVPRGRVFRVR